MPDCKSCGAWFAAVNKREALCPTCEKALARLAGYAVPVVHGRIVGSLEGGLYRRRFSCCGEDATAITQWMTPNYCPKCGAKMDGGADNA